MVGIFLFLFIIQCAWGLELNPYYSYTFSENYNFGPQISSSFGSGIINDLGCNIKIDNKNNLLFLYEISYEGPGFKEQGAFQDRSQDHLLLFLYKRKLSNILLKTKLDYVKSFSRSSVSENWDSGNYNYNKIGLSLDVISSISNVKLKIGGKIADIKYPNYTYLLREIDPEYDLPRYDHRMYRLGCEVDYRFFNGSFDMLFRNYKNEYIKNNVGEDTEEKERDKTYSLKGDFSYSFGKNLKAGISPSISFLRSNYNEVKFPEAKTAISCPSFYNYNLIEISPWASFGRKNKLHLSCIFGAKNFTNQWAENTDGTWLPEKRKDKATTFVIAFQRQINKHLSLLLSYGTKNLSSNMQRTGYNITYNSLGFKLIFEY